MFSILNRGLSWEITSLGISNSVEKRSRLIKALDNRFYVKFMQLEIDLLVLFKSQLSLFLPNLLVPTPAIS